MQSNTGRSWLSRSRFTPRSEYLAIHTLFLRLLGLIYALAFGSLGIQALSLFGSNGIAPIGPFLAEARATYGWQVYSSIPTLLWFNASDGSILLLAAGGLFAGLLLTAGKLSRVAALVCWACYLSLVSAGSPFTNFQWDALLLEAGFLALFYGSPLLVWGYRLLLFRLLFESGWVKLSSGDPSWRNFHALRYHFFTQPLPMPLAYWFHHLPPSVLDAITVITLFLELVVPVFFFFPRRLRLIAAALSALLQVAILLTGNYGFFNWLTLALILWLLDDRALGSIRRSMKPQPDPARALRYALSVAAAVLLIFQLQQLYSALLPAARWARPAPMLSFNIVNSYGLFAVMTTSRPELELEGSMDGSAWRAYTFRYKPGPTTRPLPITAPHMPRLDWQMWFAALGGYAENRWVGNLIYRLMTGDRWVTSLLAQPLPFPVKPPRYMRVKLYHYQFTDAVQRARTGAVWTRTDDGVWFGPVSLTGR